MHAPAFRQQGCHALPDLNAQNPAHLAAAICECCFVHRHVFDEPAGDTWVPESVNDNE
jgi:hypothetical protein